MDNFEWSSFPELFNDYIFTPTFIRHLFTEATTNSNERRLTPHEKYYARRGLETNKTYVKYLRVIIEDFRERIFEYLDDVLTDCFDSQLKGEFSYADMLKLEWFRFMYLGVLSKDIIQLEHLLKQLEMDANEVLDLIEEVGILRQEVDLANEKIKGMISGYNLFMNPDFARFLRELNERSS